MLKVTDHGYAELLDAQRAACPWPAPEGQLAGGGWFCGLSGAGEAGDREISSPPALRVGDPKLIDVCPL